MKRILFAAIAASAMIIACQKTEENFEQSDAHELHASIEADGASKTVLDENNNIRWSEGDQIVAFMKTSLGLKYQLKDSYIGETSGYFSKVSSGSSDDLGAGMEWDHIVAYYPYAESIKCAKSGDNYQISVILPTEQTYAPDSFGNGSWPMVAVSNDNDITFKNVCGGMKLQLKGTQKVVAIKLEGKNSEKLSGAATVTAYTDGETKPAITMASGASTSVTLNCGSGVQLNESTATEFILALPPVLFSKGFTVTVTDSDGKTHTVETDKANTVLRSSLINMPAVTLGASEGGESGEESDELIIPVSYINLNSTTLKLYVGDKGQLTAIVGPKDATDKTVVWSSANPAVATVDQTGIVTALTDGTVTITATAGGKVATCVVTISNLAVAVADYIDEYNENQGKGIPIGNVVWAPVNCGYHKDNYKYGKLYQWGRKYGQGYSGNLYDVDGQNIGKVSDATVPTIENGGISVVTGNHTSKSNVFYTGTYAYNYDWVDPRDDKLWNSGTESNPEKSQYDPCPAGWRVPTYAELSELSKNYSSWTTDENGRTGYWFGGASSYVETVSLLFLPAAGSRNNTGKAINRGSGGHYWSSRPYSDNIYGLHFNCNRAIMTTYARAEGKSVRCVQDRYGDTTPSESEAVNLSLDGTANCYIVSESGSYSFIPTKGNSMKSVGNIVAVETLWESFGTDVSPNIGELVNNVKYADGVVRFEVPSTFKEGNAVIAATDALGNILWSWHIWLTDRPREQVYYNNAGIMMDRNIGATSAIIGEVYALGLLYQWGRKDPFLGSSSVSSSSLAKSTISWPSTVSSDAINGTIEYAIANPTTFIARNHINQDWLYTGSSSTDTTRWTTSETTKSIYDPCPPGWRIPDGGDTGVWSKALGSFESFYNPTNFSSVFGSASVIWYPITGYRFSLDGRLSNVGSFGNYYSASPASKGVYMLSFTNGDIVNPSSSNPRADGFSVRCVQE